MMQTEEKRTHPRLTLGMDDGYFGHFCCPDGTTRVAQMMNISAGGLNIAASPEWASNLEQGQTLLLVSIAGGTNRSFLKKIKSEIRWIKTLGDDGYLAVGCRFMDLSENGRGQLVEFVNTERMSRGQYL